MMSVSISACRRRCVFRLRERMAGRLDMRDGSGFSRNVEPTRTGANEVIRHIVMWKLRCNFDV